MAEVMLVEDDEDLRLATAETLEGAGFRVRMFAAPAAALAALTPEFPGVILSDLRMPGMSGLDFLDLAQEAAPEVPFILITAHGDVPAALRAMRAGAHDFLEKPCAPELMLDVLRRAEEMRRLRMENTRLRARLVESGESRLIGRSTAATLLRRQLVALAPLNVDLLIAGETGTGKELCARILHDLSPRAEGPFLAVNCGALTEAEVDRALFGNADGSGLVERSAGGTLFLDELDSMPEVLQIRLLRVLEGREIMSLDWPARSVDLRILASVKEPPETLVAEGRLRADLYHRFDAGALHLPPLRERGEDALDLLLHFTAEAAARHGLPAPGVDAVLHRRAAQYFWPGNVREVRTAAERLVIGLPVTFAPPVCGGGIGAGYDAAMEEFESRLLQAALIESGGRKAEAAALLGIPRKRLYLRLRHHGLS